jgi:hypothetical protein
VEGTPAAEVISTGDSLVFTLSYFVPSTQITKNDVKLQIPTKLPAPVEGDSVTTKLTVGASAPFTAGSVTWAGLAQKNKFSAGEAPVVTIVLNAKEGYEFLSDGSGDTLASRTNLTAGDISENGTARVDYNLGNKLEITVSYAAAALLQKVSGDLLLTKSGSNLPASLTHGESVSSAPSVASTNSDIGSATFKWAGGFSGATGSEIIDIREDGGKLTAEITITPASGYTFKGFGLTANAKSDIAAVFPIGRAPTVSSVVGTVDAGSADLIVTLVYSGISKAVPTVGTSSLEGSLKTKGVVAFDGAGAVAFASSVSSDLEIINAKWTSGVSSNQYQASGSAVYAFTISVKAASQAFTTLKGTEAAWKSNFTSGWSNLTAANVKVTEDSGGESVAVLLTYTITPAELAIADALGDIVFGPSDGSFTSAAPADGLSVTGTIPSGYPQNKTGKITIVSSGAAGLGWSGAGVVSGKFDKGSSTADATYTFTIELSTGYVFPTSLNTSTATSALVTFLQSANPALGGNSSVTTKTATLSNDGIVTIVLTWTIS